jgi:hypothetical protein
VTDLTSEDLRRRFHVGTKAGAMALNLAEHMVNFYPPGPELSRALQLLEESVSWAVQANKRR